MNIILTFIVLAILAVAYFLWIRPWQLRWGVTDEELARAMPGDEDVPIPTFDATRGGHRSRAARNHLSMDRSNRGDPRRVVVQL